MSHYRKWDRMMKEWASNRTLSIGRSYAKEILNSMRLPQSNRYAVCKACRGLSLEDAYWIRQREGLYLHKVGKVVGKKR